MLYNSNVKKRKRAVCEQDKVHRMKQEQSVKDCQNVQIETTATYQKKEIKVVLEFPQRADGKAEEEFQRRLKEIYLNRVNFKAMQLEESALQSASPNKSIGLKTNDMEDKDNG